MRPATHGSEGLYGCGRLATHDGAPLRPGGLELTEELIDLAEFAAGDRVLDVGCGQGASTRLLVGRGVEAVGVDIDLDAVTDPWTPLVVADATRLPFADASLDGVLAECVLSTLADPGRALAEWARVLKPGGRLALSDVVSRAAGGRTR
ncbi:MAG TPA: class I SAM-dependent methyltransferase, partial [Roseiarcus sp.]|nr:class I SAM-dependent methyltransferase [Roseiarcus sp.]